MNLCTSSQDPSLHFAYQLHLLSPNQGRCSTSSALPFLRYEIFSLLVFHISMQTCCCVSNFFFKKPSLDLISPSSFHPTSLLPFVAKLLERIVSTHYLQFDSFPSLSHPFQSTLAPTTPPKLLVGVTSDLHAAQLLALIFLEASVAFQSLAYFLQS